MRYKRGFFLYVVGLFLLCSFGWFRYLQPNSGIPVGQDYHQHISIVQHLKELDLFPALHSDKPNAHMVSKYLPIYHGLLMVHVVAAGIEVLGIPLPSAFLLIMDFCFLVFVSFLIYLIFFAKISDSWINKASAAFAFIVIFCPYFGNSITYGFYAQLFSYCLLVTAILFYRAGHRRPAILAVIFSVFTYPDFLLWVLPLLVFPVFKVPRFLRVVAALFWAILIKTLYARLSLAAMVSDNLLPFLFTTLGFFLFSKELVNKNRNLFFLLLSFVLQCSLFLLAKVNFFNFSYYSLKLAASACFFLPIILLYIDNKKAVGLLFSTLFFVFFFMLGDKDYSNFKKYLMGTPEISNKNYLEYVSLRRNIDLFEAEGFCSSKDTLSLINLPQAQFGKKLETRCFTENAILKNYDFYDLKFKNQALQNIFNGLDTCENNDRNINLLNLKLNVSQPSKNYSDQTAFCLITTEDQFESIKKYKNLKLFRKTGNIIYAKVTAEK